MTARDIMTRNIVSVGPKVGLQEIARALLSAGVGAVPVVDDDGRPIGVVSEWDLIGQHAPEREARRDRWLSQLAEGQSMASMYIETTRPNARTAEEVMSRPVITVGEDAEIVEIARVVTERRVKQVFVVAEGRLVGVVSRSDLTRALAENGHERHPARAEVEEPEPSPQTPPPPTVAIAAGDGPSADVFRHLVEAHEAAEAAAREEEKRAQDRARLELVKRLAGEHLGDREWHDLLGLARAAAERGEKEFLLMRFPARLCADGGRMINVPDPDWPTSLRGKAADLFERWQAELKPRGFGLTARILEFPGGFPGDVGLTLVWGDA